ncbi:MAG: MerR family transcriptional regulator [Alphaproteobacteria bacterium]|nr:MerR family transcriptional regulator [Alphaproteobacteria bacterium]
MDAEYFVSINEVAKRLNVPAHTLRYWEKQFPVAIRPTTGAGGRRYYRGETVAKLETIKSLLYDRGMTIAGVKKLIHDGELPKSPDEFVVKTTPSQPKQTVAAATQPMPADISDEVETVISLLNTAREILSAV